MRDRVDCRFRRGVAGHRPPAAVAPASAPSATPACPARVIANRSGPCPCERGSVAIANVRFHAANRALTSIGKSARKHAPSFEGSRTRQHERALWFSPSLLGPRCSSTERERARRRRWRSFSCLTGRHTIELRNGQRQPYVTEVDVEAGRPLRISHLFQ